jgi:hypothetical protein
LLAAVHTWILATALSAGFGTVLVLVGIALLGVAWFALRFWLASTRPPNIREIQTPALDRLNREALEAMGKEEAEDDEEAPEGLRKLIPEEPGDQKLGAR